MKAEIKPQIEGYGLSSQQAVVWNYELAGTGDAPYRVQCSLSISGPLDAERLARSMDRFVQQHEILRTAFVSLPGMTLPVQVIDQASKARLRTRDISQIPADEQPAALSRLWTELLESPFDYAEAPLLHALLVCQSDDLHRLILSVPSLCADPASLRNLVRGLVEEEPDARQKGEAPLQYADYAAWQAEIAQTEDARVAKKYWLAQIDRDLLKIGLPSRHSPSLVRESARLSTVSALLDGATCRRHGALASEHGVSLKTWYLSCWLVLLQRHLGSRSVLLGLESEARGGELDTALGIYRKTLPLLCDIDTGKLFADWVKDVEKHVLEMYEWQDYFSGRELEEANVSQETGWPFCFAFHDWSETLSSDGLTFTLDDLYCRTERSDLALCCIQREASLELLVHCDSGAYDEAFARCLLEQLEALLNSVARHADARLNALNITGEAERRRLLIEWNDTAVDYPHDLCLHQLFESQAERTPNAVAVVFEGQRLTYAELNAEANRLAHHLRRLGVGPEVLAGICVERSPEMVIGILGVLKTGGAYVPIDPSHPPERIAQLAKEAKPAVILAQERLAGLLPADIPRLYLDAQNQSVVAESGENPNTRISPQSLAYVIYTSGSTGNPKGVGVSHRNAVHSTAARLAYYQDGVSGFLLLSSIAFDSSVAGLFGTLCSGGRLVLPRDDQVTDPVQLAELIQHREVSHLLAVPLLYDALLVQLAEGHGSSLKVAIVAGEVCGKNLVERHVQWLPHAQLYNEYGPTETSVWSTVHRCDTDTGTGVPIGRPIANTRLYVLDDRLEPVATGVAGELYIGGEGVSRGYLGHGELTAEKFIPDPYGAEGGRLYRTGDRVRYRPDGSLEFVGRIDTQVKIRGFRVELGEIEIALSQHPSVKEAVVTLREDTLGDKRLMAYVTGKDTPPAPEELRVYLKTHLPDYMVPAAIVPLNTFPLSPNGKVDRKALPAPDLSGHLARHYIAPRNLIEETLAKVWAGVLGVERVGIRDSFFDLGGDSILGIRVASQAKQAGLIVTPRQLFQNPTVEALATVVDSSLPAVSEQGLVTGDVPLTPIQHWFFEQSLAARDHWNQALLFEARQVLDTSALEAAVGYLDQHHDALRMRFAKEDGRWRQYSLAEPSAGVFQRVDLSGQSGAARLQALAIEANRWQGSLDLEKGPLWRAVHFDFGPSEPSRLLIVIHHLVVDGVSWRILLEDLQTAYRQLVQGEPVTLPLKTAPYQRWAKRLKELVDSGVLSEEISYWSEASRTSNTVLPVDDPIGQNTEAVAEEIVTFLDEADTQASLRDVPPVYRTRINDLLLTALARTISVWSGSETVVVDLEGHGREDLIENLDISRTVGWFTSVYPVSLTLPQTASPGDAIKAVKEQLRAVPNNGIGYGLLRYLGGSEAAETAKADSVTNCASMPTLPLGEGGGEGTSGDSICVCTKTTPQLSFNYLGQLDQSLPENSLFGIAQESIGLSRATVNQRSHELDVIAHVLRGRLRVSWTYSKARYQKASIEHLAHAYIASLHALIRHCLTSEAGGCTPSDFPLAQLNQPELNALAGRGADIEDIYPLAPLQHGLIFHSLYAPESGVYCNQFSCLLTGDLDVEAFIEAWLGLVARHPVLRTAFLAEGRDQPLQVVYRRAELPIERLDWRSLATDLQAQRWQDYLAEDRSRGFEFGCAPLMRLALARCAEDSHYFLWTHHHVVLDGWCTPLIFKEVFTTYEALRRGEESTRTPSRPYRDYIAWLQAQTPSEAEAYWSDALSGFSAATPLPLAHTAAGGRDSGWEEHHFVLPPDDAARLEGVVKRHQLTLNTLVQGVWALLLSRYSGERDVVFGITVSGRPADLPGVDRMIGLFINTVPLRVRLRPEIRVSDWLHGLLQQNLELRRFEHTSLVDIQGWSEVPRGQMLFESLLVFENYPVDWTIEDQAASLGVRDVIFTEQTSYPLTITAAQIPGKGLVVRIDYQRGCFEEAAIARMAGHFQTLLNGMVANPEARLSELPMLSESERHRLLVEWNATGAEFPWDKCIHELFEAQVERTPGTVAVVFEDQRLTYAELNAKANQLARHLKTLGVGPDVLVGICMERSLEMVIGILGVLKAGGAYVPLDPEYPRERVTYMLEDAKPRVVLTQTPIMEVLPEHIRCICLDSQWAAIDRESCENLPTVMYPRNLAYVIYTSGSTGKPKGVAIAHHNTVGLLTWAKVVFTPENIAEVLASTSLCFDLSVFEIFVPLSWGGKVIIGEGILQLTNRKEGMATVTLVNTVPSAMNEIVGSGFIPRSVSTVNLAGEPLSSSLVEALYQHTAIEQVFNLYGPSETTTYSSFALIEKRTGQRPSIGRPIANTQIYLLDRFLEPVPEGVPGELYIGGVGLARGYLNRPDLTAERFIPNPFGDKPGERLYKTGDLAHYRLDGNLEFLGRIDHQVKIRGFRIELGEIEVALSQHIGVKEAVVIAREDTPGDKRLVAYLVGNEPRPGVADLRAWLKERLPEYMAPAAFVFLDALPLTPNGKVDRKALPAPNVSAQLIHQYVAPRNSTEEILVKIWTEVLGVERVGIQDNFFELGGHSLTATQVVSRMEKVLGKTIPLSVFFETSTIQSMATAIDLIRRPRVGELDQFQDSEVEVISL